MSQVGLQWELKWTKWGFNRALQGFKQAKWSLVDAHLVHVGVHIDQVGPQSAPVCPFAHCMPHLARMGQVDYQMGKQGPQTGLK